MKLALANILVLVLLSLTIYSQTQSSTIREERPMISPPIAPVIRRMERVIPLSSNPDGVRAVNRQAIMEKQRNLLYRRPTDSELSSVSPDKDIVERYAGFLKNPGTGLFRLLPDAGCDDDTLILAASQICMLRTMPGSGSSYSFRNETYAISRLADLTFRDGSVIASGALTHGMIVDLGNVLLEGVTEKTPGIEYLTGFQPAAGVASAKAKDLELISGVTSGGHLYRRSVKAEESRTYALRMVAYRGKLLRTAAKGVVYNELDFDNRRDILVAFRIVRSDGENGISILWKKLADRESPRLKTISDR